MKLKCTLKRYIHCHVGYRFNQLMINKYRTYSYLTSYMHLFWLQQTIETFWKCHHAVCVCTCTMKQFPWSLKLWTESMTKWSLSSRSNDMLRITLHHSVTSDNMLMHIPVHTWHRYIRWCRTCLIIWHWMRIVKCPSEFSAFFWY